jgi:mRNA interferase YafQ
MRKIEREIDWTSAFKRDFRREKKKDRQLEDTLGSVLTDLANDIPLPEKFADHPMTGHGRIIGIATSSLTLC